MKYLALIASVIALSATQTWANTSNDRCAITGTDLWFDLGSSSPADEGSRSFENLTVSKPVSKTHDRKVLSVDLNSPLYLVEYADGLLSDGANYFMLRITNRRNEKQSLYMFQREASASTPAFSKVTSNLRGLNIPESVKATVSCITD